MDANDSPRDIRQGGSIEPVQLPAADSAATRLKPQAGERYELRDPFDEVTYRFDRLEQMIGKAEELGANRFFAVTADGQRIPISKASGEWTRADPPATERARMTTSAPRHISEVL